MTADIAISDRVRLALAERRPVVALESTIISHGLPRPRNLEAARLFERTLEEQGATPATIAVVDGVPTIGVEGDGLRRLAADDVLKVSARDLPMAAAGGRTGATTVAATAYLARRAGIRVFATGGLGGVHRGAAQTFDESADLLALAETPITVVAAGCKSVLDVAATLERLETFNVPVVGYGTDRFPGFWLADSGHDLDWRVDTPEQVAEIMDAADRLGRRQGILVGNPVSTDRQLDPDLHDRALAESLRAAEERGVRGKEVTPFLLDHIHRATDGASLDVNIDLALNNVTVGGLIAHAWSDLGSVVSV